MPEPGRKLPAVHVGQANVEQHDVGAIVRRGLLDFKAGITNVDIMAGGRYPLGQRIRRIAMVFDDQYSQSFHCLPNEKSHDVYAVAVLASSV